MTSQSLISVLSVPFNSCKAWKPQLQTLAGDLSSPTAEDPPNPTIAASGYGSEADAGSPRRTTPRGLNFQEPVRQPPREPGPEAPPAGASPPRGQGPRPWAHLTMAVTTRQVRGDAESRPGPSGDALKLEVRE